MAWTRPSLTNIRDRIKQDFLSRLTGVDDAPLRRSVENAFAYALAGASHGLYGFIQWGTRQFIPSEDSDLDSLLRWANDLLTPPQNLASAAIGNVTFTGIDTTVIPAGTEITNYDGQLFTTDAEYVISGTTITGAVTASEPGAAGNTEEGAFVFLSTPIPDIEDQAVVASGGLGGGADDEDKFGVLARLRWRFKHPPRGGSTGDYVTWATSVPAVTRAFEFSNDPMVGWVKVIVVDDNNNITPSAQTVVDAETAINAARPIMMGGVVVSGPIPQTLNLTWSGLLPDDTPTRTALEANVNDWIWTVGEPGIALSQPDIENAAQAVVTQVSLSSPTADPDPGEYGMFVTINHSYI